MDTDQYLTTEEVLEYLHLNLKTVYRLLKAGKLPAVRVGRQWRFRKQDIDAFLAASGSKAAVEARPVRVLVVDDEESVRTLISTTLSASHGSLEIDAAADGQTALQMLRAQEFGLLIADLKMSPMDGLTLIREARAHAPDLPVVIVTGLPSEESAIEAINIGVSGYLLKPFRIAQVLEVVHRALRTAV